MSASEPAGSATRLLRLILVLGAVAVLLGMLPGVTGAGLAAAALGLGLAPGLWLARWTSPRDRIWLTVCRALFLAPLVAGTLGGGLLFLGLNPMTAARIVAGIGLLTAFAALRGRRPVAPRWERRLVFWLVVLAALVLVPHALREWVRLRSDAWFHTAVAYEIEARGLPPGDPYFAGLRLNYTWFYHVVVVLWSSLAGVVPWSVGGLINAGWLVSLAGGVFTLSRRLARPAREAFFAALFVPLGLEAGFWLWLPLKLARAWTGESAGTEHLEHLMGLTPFTFERVLNFTSTFGSSPPFFNKFVVMSAFGGGVTAAVWALEGTARVALRRKSVRLPGHPLVLLGLAGFGLWVLHPAAGLSVVPALAAAGVVLILRPQGFPTRGVLLAALALAAGSLPGLGFLALCAGRAENAWPFGFDPAAARSILIGSTVAIPLAIAGLRRLHAGGGSRLARLLAVALPAASLVVVLPPPNTTDKLAFLFYLMPAVAAGWFLGRLWFVSRVRGRTGAYVSGLGLLLLPVNLLYLGVFLFSPPHRLVPPADPPLYAWLAAETAEDAVILDTADRDDVLVRVPRRQYWGREAYATQWGYPADTMGRRRLVRDVFVPRGGLGSEPGAPDTRQALATLTEFVTREGVPVYLLWRPGDHGGAPGDSSLAGRLPERFKPVWRGSAGTVYRFHP